MVDTDALIGRLSDNLLPVKRLRPPMIRATLWLTIVGLLLAFVVGAFADMGAFMTRAADSKLSLELIGTLLTGILAVIAAFELSLPDQSIAWALLPLPSFLLWIGSSGYSCWRHWVESGPQGLQIGESASCFAWIVGFGIPLAIALSIPLRRSRPLSPGPVAAMAGLGVASLAAFLLQFFHPFDVTVMDLGLHLAAVATVVVLARSAAHAAQASRSMTRG